MGANNADVITIAKLMELQIPWSKLNRIRHHTQLDHIRHTLLKISGDLKWS